MRKLNKKAAAFIVGGAVAVASAGTAYAYWTTSGSGTGTASTSAGGALVDVTTSEATPIAAMYPGDAAQPLKATVTNQDPNQKVYVTRVKAYLTVQTAEDAVGPCSTADYLLNGTADTSLTNQVTLNWTAQELAQSTSADTNGTGDTIQFNNRPVNQDGCKDATVTLNYVAEAV